MNKQRIGLHFLGIWVAGSSLLSAETIVVFPAADTTMIEVAPNNNLGGQPFFNAGGNQSRSRNRGLLRFDIYDLIPVGATVQSASLSLSVVKLPGAGANPGNFQLHRVLQPWGEGNKSVPDGAGPGFGLAATLNEATWTHRYAQTTNTWGAPGAAPDLDYVAQASAEQFVYDLSNSPYTFGSTPPMVADVIFWLENPGQNYGWILICQDETVTGTARRFGAREDTNNAPQLHLEYSLAAASRRFVSARLLNNLLLLEIQASPGQNSEIQYRDDLVAGAWSFLTNFAASASSHYVLQIPVEGSQRYYRLKY